MQRLSKDGHAHSVTADSIKAPFAASCHLTWRRHTCLRRLPRGPQAVSPGVGHAGTIAYAVRKEPIEERVSALKAQPKSSGDSRDG
ncbi:hypothetical protein QJQ45_027008 [Haematococcus lacustris]|nr:hypothetical protein QJQ45_027008 [Haematococcus lacustris]